MLLGKQKLNLNSVSANIADKHSSVLKVYIELKRLTCQY